VVQRTSLGGGRSPLELVKQPAASPALKKKITGWQGEQGRGEVRRKRNPYGHVISLLRRAFAPQRGFSDSRPPAWTLHARPARAAQ
jgi:hypothetical protein